MGTPTEARTANVQQSLGAFTDTGWEFVADEWIFGDDGTLCPDCGRPMQNSYWSVDDVGAVHGMGCTRCQTVVPYPPPGSLSNLDTTTVTTRSGERIEVGVSGGA